MVATLVFANANAWAWYFGHDFEAPFFSRVHTKKSTLNIQYWFGTDLI